MMCVAACLLLANRLPAQTAGWQFRWQPGQTLTYRVEHITNASETVGSEKSESKTRLVLTKEWKILDVDGVGVATLQLTLKALRLETATGTGWLIFDSADPGKSDPDLRSQVQKFVGEPLATIRVDGRGRVVEVKESKHGPASRFESELPFVVILPEDGPRVNQTWERAYKITVEPPQGTGEKYEAVQKYLCKNVEPASAVIALSTGFKTMPENVLDRVPLLQLQPEGEAVFDLESGRLKRAAWHIQKEISGQQGEGSSYRFASTYTEELQ
jgi:hypothetical protein